MDDLRDKLGRLTPFDDMYAPMMLDWVGGEEELFFLAPRTRPPLTTEKILSWKEDNDHAYLFWGDDGRFPIGYGEINRMPNALAHWWLGHLIIAPSKRKQGWGRKLVLALFEEAFERLMGREISLVVFPENREAVRCYERCGMEVLGNQFKEFDSTGRKHRMLHMKMTVKKYGGMMTGLGRAGAQDPQT